MARRRRGLMVQYRAGEVGGLEPLVLVQPDHRLKQLLSKVLLDQLLLELKTLLLLLASLLRAIDLHLDMLLGT